MDYDLLFDCNILRLFFNYLTYVCLKFFFLTSGADNFINYLEVEKSTCKVFTPCEDI